MNHRRWLTVLCALLLLASGLGGDVVHLKTGSTLRGEVVSEDARSIVLRTPHSLLTIPRADVERIERETPAETLKGLGRDALRRRRYDRALEYLRQALKADPDDDELPSLIRSAYRGRIRALLDEGRYREAQSLLEEAAGAGLSTSDLAGVATELADRRSEFERLQARAQSEVEVGQYRRALESYRRLLELAPVRRRELVKAQARVYLQYGDSLFRERNFQEARIQYQEALRLDPELLPQLEDKLVASTISVINDELERAQGPLPTRRALELARQLQHLLALKPDLPHTHLLMGVVYEHLRRPRLALSEYQQVLGEAVPGASLAERVLEARRRAQALVSRTPLRVDAASRSEDWNYFEPGDWQVDRSPHFRLHHHNPRVSARLLAAAEYHLRREAPFFGLDPEEVWKAPCDIFLHRDAEAYHQATGRPLWSPGVSTFTKTDDTVQVAIHTHQEARLLGQTVIPHELGHLLLARVTGYVPDLPLWIQEGVAVSQEPSFKRDYLLREVAARRAAGSGMSLEEVLRTTDYPRAEDVDQYYGLSYSLVQFLLSRGDFARLRRFALDARGDLAEALKRHYEMTVEELKEAWEKYLETALSGEAPEPSAPSPSR